jgi:hypothetical protein
MIPPHSDCEKTKPIKFSFVFVKVQCQCDAVTPLTPAPVKIPARCLG